MRCWRIGAILYQEIPLLVLVEFSFPLKNYLGYFPKKCFVASKHLQLPQQQLSFTFFKYEAIHLDNMYCYMLYKI